MKDRWFLSLPDQDDLERLLIWICCVLSLKKQMKIHHAILRTKRYGSVVRNLFSGGLKDNKDLSYGFLTGILRVSKESIFSGLNNLVIHSVLDNKYSEYFGFTSDEVKEMAEYYGVPDKYEEICQWYDGYQFGKTEIFNPWSVINYFNNQCEPRAFWQSTGSNDIIGEIIEQADEEIYARLMSLVNGKTFTTYVDTEMVSEGISIIYKYGVAFSGKSVEITVV